MHLTVFMTRVYDLQPFFRRASQGHAVGSAQCRVTWVTWECFSMLALHSPRHADHLKCTHLTVFMTRVYDLQS
jgi:hypothetical protein